MSKSIRRRVLRTHPLDEYENLVFRLQGSRILLSVYSEDVAQQRSVG